MATYNIVFTSGVKSQVSTSLLGAKREASKFLTHGNGVTVCDSNFNPICKRDFWSAGNRFGWSKWVLCDL